jgi:hemolysin activation/secretion protein
MSTPGSKFALTAALALAWAVPANGQPEEVPTARPPVAQQSDPGLPESQSPTSVVPGKVQVNRFQMSGKSDLLTESEFRSVVDRFEGRPLAVEEMQQVAQALTDLLKSKGYFLARVLLPVQEVKDGEVRLELLPGSIGKITVEGNQAYSSEFIQDTVESALGPGRVVTEEDLQRKLLLLNDNTDLFVTALFQPGTEKGQADLTLAVEDSTPIHGGLGYDNFGTQFTDIHRVSPHLSLGNVFSDGDTLAARYLLGLPDNRANFLQANYSTLVDLDGSRLSLSYANGASTLGQDLQVLDIRGRANIYALTYSHPLQRTQTQRQDLTVGYSYKQFDNSLLGLATGQDRYHSLRLGYSGDFSDLDGRTLLGAALTQGLGGSTLNSSLGRLGVNAGFTKLNLDVARIQNIDTPFFLVLRASGQWTPAPIFAAEQFALGGVDSVRGFNQAQFLGDVGYSLSAEARWVPWEERRDVQFAAFIDHGYASVLQPQPGQLASQSLTGAGLGVRFNVGPAAQLRLDVGWPLSPGVNLSGDKPVYYGQVYTRF